MDVQVAAWQRGYVAPASISPITTICSQANRILRAIERNDLWTDLCLKEVFDFRLLTPRNAYSYTSSQDISLDLANTKVMFSKEVWEWLRQNTHGKLFVAYCEALQEVQPIFEETLRVYNLFHEFLETSVDCCIVPMYVQIQEATFLNNFYACLLYTSPKPTRPY